MLTLVNPNTTSLFAFPTSTCFLSTTNNPLFPTTTTTTPSTTNTNTYQRTAAIPASSTTTTTTGTECSISSPTTNLKITLKLSRKRQLLQADESSDDVEQHEVPLQTVHTQQSTASSETKLDQHVIPQVDNYKRSKTSNFAQLQRDLFELYYRMTTTSQLLTHDESSSEEQNHQLQASLEIMQQQYNELQRQLEVVRKVHEEQLNNEEEEEEQDDDEDASDDDEEEDSVSCFRDSLDDSMIDEVSEVQEYESKNNSSNNNKRRVRIRLDCNQIFIVERLQYVYDDNASWMSSTSSANKACCSNENECIENVAEDEEELFDYYDSSELFNL